MKIEFRLGDLEYKYERPSMPAGRFRALLLLGAAALYVCLVLGLVYLSSAFSAGVIAVITLLAPMLYSAFKSDF